MTRHPDDLPITYASTRRTIGLHKREDPEFSTLHLNRVIRRQIRYVKCEHCDDDGIDLIWYNSYNHLRVECGPDDPGAVRYMCERCGGLGFVETW